MRRVAGVAQSSLLMKSAPRVMAWCSGQRPTGGGDKKGYDPPVGKL